MEMHFLMLVIQAFVATGYALQNSSDSNELVTIKTVQNDAENYQWPAVDDLQNEYVLLRLRSFAKICFTWQGVSPQMVSLFKDLNSSLIINGLLEGRSAKKENITEPLLLTRLGVTLNGVKILIDTNAATVVRAEEDGGAVHLALKDTEGYDYHHSGISFKMIPATEALSFLSVEFENKIVIIELHYLANMPQFLKISIPNLHSFVNKSIDGIFGKLWKKSRKITVTENEGKRGVLNFGEKKIPVVKSKVAYKDFNRSVSCWYLPNPSLLFGDFVNFQVQSLITR